CARLGAAGFDYW
nr:immunoglobulin heavy chain junction region [Macaca mulatta]MOX92898.1 immunoglobulin heavy chain junction region [Macaca mulatta]